MVEAEEGRRLELSGSLHSGERMYLLDARRSPEYISRYRYVNSSKVCSLSGAMCICGPHFFLGRLKAMQKCLITSIVHNFKYKLTR